MHSAQPNPRALLFDETSGAPSPFRLPEWRGCALERDNFDNTRLSSVLFEALVAASNPDAIIIYGHINGREIAACVDPTWAAYSNFMLNHDNWSLEYVITVPAHQWVALSDPDVTIVGCEASIAAPADSVLAKSGLSLSEITHQQFPGLDPAMPNDRYLLAAIG